MFPLAFPYSILKKYGTSGERVIDPFCGRGTTNYASRLLGMASVGIDSSNVAVALTQAKIANTNTALILSAALQIITEIPSPSHVPQGEFWELAYHPRVLRLLCRLREGLIANCNTDARKGLRAIIMGALHGPQPKTRDSYFSNQCPRTYAPKPDYAVRFWTKHKMKPKDVDILSIIRERALRYFESENTAPGGLIVKGDSRQASSYDLLTADGGFGWAITSPPYYGMTTYISDQWLRNWFVGGNERVEYSTATQITHTSPEAFSLDLRKVWENVASASRNGARLVIRFGGINYRKVEPLDVLKFSLKDTRWKIVTVKSAGTPKKGRRQAETFTNVASPVAEYDVWTRLQ